MENERFFENPNSLNWQSHHTPELNSGDHPCFLNLNWDRSIDQNNAQFESALSSLVSSPNSNPPAAESVVIRELIGRLGSICNSGERSPPSHYHNSCYSTPVNSPPKLNLAMMDSRPVLGPFDPGFAERAARFSCFGAARQFGIQEPGKLSRVSSSQSLKGVGVSEIPMQDGIQLEMEMRSRFGTLPVPDEGEFGNSESSASDRVSPVEGNVRKRKTTAKGRGKEAPLSNPPTVAEDEDMNSKRCRSSEAGGDEQSAGIKPKAEQNASTKGDADKKKGKENNANLPEPPKDYIHVRARRGQATDSHSLAERVRREKISERMKFLQDLVPGCNKVTGKAVMLDEIINYVQSLQRQVEFLSMKLATVNPRLEFNIENIIPKEMNQGNSIYPLEAASTVFSYAHQPQSFVTSGLETHYTMNTLDSSLRRSLGMQSAPIDGFVDANSQLGTLWEDDLQSVVHMGFGQNQEAAFSSQSFHGLLPTAHMKIEL